MAAALVVVVVLGCSPTASERPLAAPTTAATLAPPSQPAVATSPTPQASLGRDAAWRADIASLVPGMAAIHPDLTHSVSREELDAAATRLSATVASATDDELMVGVLRIVAMVSSAGCDAHTGAFIWGTGTYPVDSLPLRLWLFANDEGRDEVVVVDALPPYERLIGSRIDGVGSNAIADVLAELDPLIPRDNAQTVRLLMPRFLLIPQLLRGLGLVGGVAVALALTAPDGASDTVFVGPIPMAEYNAWAGPYGLHLPVDANVPYLSRIQDALWWDMLEDGETLYLQYNRVDPLPSSLEADLETALADPAVARVVLDIRHNYGGELSALDAITPVLVGAAKGEADRLFVIIGRNTFSGGSLLAARLKEAKATIVGEPTGGCPTIWSDPADLLLPGSGITVGVASETAVGVDPNDARLTIEPDVQAVISREDWADGRDPALDILVGDGP
jgi:hypothetical protein